MMENCVFNLINVTETTFLTQSWLKLTTSIKWPSVSIDHLYLPVLKMSPVLKDHLCLKIASIQRQIVFKGLLYSRDNMYLTTNCI